MNWSDVLQWRSEPLAEYGREAEKHSRELQEAAERLVARLNSLTGRGQTVTAVRRALTQRISVIDEQVNYLISVSEIASAGVDGIDDIRADIADIQETSDYHVPQGHAWVSAAPYAYDLVQGLGTDVNFGRNPDTMPGFHHLSGDVGPAPKTYDPVGLHMAYFNMGTQAQREIAGVIAGVGRS